MLFGVVGQRAAPTARNPPGGTDRTSSVRLIDFIAPGLLILAAWTIVLHHLGLLSFWVDEGFSWDIARQGISTILQALPDQDRHPPLQYILLWLAMRLAGQSEFSLRFVSASAGLLAIPLIYRVGRMLGGAWVGFFAAVLLTVSPFEVWYAQEARMYALLAMLGLASWFMFLRVCRDGGRVDWIGYILVTAAALYTHYYAFFLLPAQLLAFAFEGPWRRWRVVLLGFVASGVLFVPWLLAIWRQYQRASLGYHPELGLPSVLGNVLATYSLGESARFANPLVIAAVVLAGIGVLPLPNPENKASPRSASRWSGVILAGWALAAPLGAYGITLVTGLDIRATGRMYYIAGLPAFLLLVARGLVWLDWRFRRAFRAPNRLRLAPIGFTLPLVALVGIALVGGVEATTLRQQFALDKKEDFRGAAQIVSDHEWPGDTIVLNAEYIYRAFTYYYHGTSPWNRAVVEPSRVDAALTQQTAGHQRVWLVLSHAEFSDPDHRVQSWLDQHGTPLQDWWLDGIHVRLYSMEHHPRLDRPAVARTIGVKLGDHVEVTGVDAPDKGTGGTTAHVTVVWHALSRPTEDDHAVLMLVDSAQHVWQQVDEIPISPFYLPTTWQPGEYLTDRYDLDLPLGLPPGPYQLQLKLYNPANGREFPVSTGGETATLGTIQVSPSVASTVLPGTDLVSGLRLLGASIDRTTARPGDPVVAELTWQATEHPTGPVQLPLDLVDAKGQTSDERTFDVGGANPFDHWVPQEVVRDRVTLTVPGRASAGTYHVRVGQNGGLDVGAIQIEPIQRTFTPPSPSHAQTARLTSPDGGDVAELLGYDLTPSTLSPGGHLRLTLYWQATGEPTVDYTVFTHVIGPDGNVHGQKDSVPAGGARPTEGWLKGEIIRDDYDLTVAGDAPLGTYTIEVGMYQPDTGARLTIGKNTAVILGESIEVNRGQ